MPTTEQNTSTDRRSRFRAHMHAFNPTAPAAAVINDGFVLEGLHKGLYRHIAARADLEPRGCQVVIGGIGSGKTTEMLLASNLLEADGRFVSFFIDVTKETDISELNYGSLVAAFGLHLSKFVLPKAQKAIIGNEEKTQIEKSAKSIRDFAYGKTEYQWVENSPYDEDDYAPSEDDPGDGRYIIKTVAGKLVSPFPALKRELFAIKKDLRALIKFVTDRELELAIFFDGLDRLVSPEKFWSVADQDLRFLRDLEIPVVCTGPISLLYGSGRPTADFFDRVRHIPAIAASNKVLKEVIQARQGQRLLSDSQIRILCRASGGLLRDLIGLARNSAEEAYVADSATIDDSDIHSAITQLGDGYRRGLGTPQIAALNKLLADKGFDAGSAVGIELLVTRCVIEYSATDFKVHPALKGVLKVRKRV